MSIPCSSECVPREKEREREKKERSSFSFLLLTHVSRRCCNKISQNKSSESGVLEEPPLWDQAELDDIFAPRRVHVASRRWTWGCARRRGKVSFFHRGRTQLTDAQRARKEKELTPGQQKLKLCLKVKRMYICRLT